MNKAKYSFMVLLTINKYDSGPEITNIYPTDQKNNDDVLYIKWGE